MLLNLFCLTLFPRKTSMLFFLCFSVCTISPTSHPTSFLIFYLSLLFNQLVLLHACFLCLGSIYLLESVALGFIYILGNFVRYFFKNFFYPTSFFFPLGTQCVNIRKLDILLWFTNTQFRLVGHFFLSVSFWMVFITIFLGSLYFFQYCLVFC